MVQNLKTLQNYLIRCIYGRSIFRMISLITIIALTLIFISKIQLFKLEHDSSKASTKNEIKFLNQDLIQSNEKIDKIISKTTFKSIKEKVASIKVTDKAVINSIKIFSGKIPVKINFTFNVPNDSLMKFVSNDILMKDMNENSKKLDSSLQSKPFDYDKNARFCICSKISQPCVCCIKLAEENIGLTKSLCSNITYIPKQKAAKISMQYGKLNKLGDFVFIDIYYPPPVCLSQTIQFDQKSQELFKQKEEISVNKPIKNKIILDICFQTRNLTYNVNIDSSHKTEFKGCSNFYVKLNDMIIHIYPLGCFKAGHESKDLQIQKMVNGIP